MNKHLYNYLLRRLVTFPVTFSRNKQFDSYNSPEGIQAIKRAHTIRNFKNMLYDIDKYKYVAQKLQNGDIQISFYDPALDLKNDFFLNSFEWSILQSEFKTGELIDNYFPNF